jgi:multidrug efflux pump subunit AcrB
MLSALCIRRPVMTILLMASFIIAGAFGYKQLPVAAIPRVEFPTIQVTAQLPGASPETMAASVASILERQFSTIAGVTTMTSTSSLGNTSIVLQFDFNRSIDGAALDVQSAISSAMRRLPPEMTTPPSFRKVNPADWAVMFLALRSSQVRLSDIDAFANRSILPRISTLPGVAQVLIFGTQKYAVRVRANLDQLAVRGLTLQELQTAVVNANSSKPVGAIADHRQSSILDATGPINKAADYMPVIVTWQNGAPVRVSDVATAVDSVENDKVASWLNGTRAIVLGVYRQPDGNTVEVVDRVKAMLPAIQAELPPGVEIELLADRSQPIRHAIADVEFTLLLAAVLVIIAIYFFLRSFRATLIPAIALPISIIGTFAAMYVCGHSIDNISLLALTLAVGFVVDDAIVMLENIVRHIEAGEKPMEAAFKGSKEVGFTIISMTLSLVAVFIPVLFMGGVVGRMFNEFGLVISFAILISGIVSLTLTPMLCSRLLKPVDHNERHNALLRLFEWSFTKVSNGYAWALARTVAMPRLVLAVTLGTFVLTAILFQMVPKGFFPSEDIGQISGSTVGPDDASFDAMVARQGALAEVIKRDPDVASVLSIVGGGNAAATVNSGRMFIILRDKPERKDSALQVIARLRRATAAVPGINIFFQPVQSINIGTTQTRAQYQFGMRSSDLAALREYAPLMEQRMRRIPSIMDVNSDLQVRARSTVGRHLPGDPRGRSQVRRRQRRAAQDADPHPERFTGSPRYRGQAQRQADVADGQSHRPAALGHQLLQPGARSGARPGRGGHPGGRRRDRTAGQYRHQLRRQCAGLPAGRRQPGHAAVRGGAGDLHHPRHPLRKLHPSADHPVRPALGRHRRAADPDAVRHGSQRHRHDRRRHADRHRQEERDHDGRLRDRAARAGRHRRAGDRRGGKSALPADHDDHGLRASGRAAYCHWRRCRRRAAPAVGHYGGGRSDGVAASDAVHHTGGLHLVRQAHRHALQAALEQPAA